MDDNWKIGGLEFDTSTLAYDAAIVLLLGMHYGDRLALDMDWEESSDAVR